MSISKRHYLNLLEKIHCPENEAILLKISDIVEPHSDAIARHFYNTMLGNAKAAHFINHDIVKKRLRASMSAWITSAFCYQNSSQLLNEYVDYQIKVGCVHGRIDLPMRFVDYGMFLIKAEVLRLLKESALDKNQQTTAMILAVQLLDIALALINESYQGDMVVNEKNAQSFKLQFSTHNLAFDCEKLRASLSDWMRELLLTIQQERFDAGNIATVRHSNFGLWVVHKAKLFLPVSEYEMLVQLLNTMDESVSCLVNDFEHLETRKETLGLLNHSVSKAMWLLGDIAKAIIDQDSGRDPLTRLFNRRYLETVLRHEIECSLQNDLIFGLVMLDIDFFKKINDSYGHDVGDKVLTQLADILVHEIRAGDFIFRLGGEEFLIVLSDINTQILERVGEKIRGIVEQTDFVIDDGQILTLTVSVGIAAHDGHPDFLRTLKQADEALYEAKNSGRNRVIVAKPPVTTYAQLEELKI